MYCLIFFYYATRTELGPIRPVGKFLSVKMLVFFTWWQSVGIALLYQWGMIPEALVNVEHDWTTEDVAKGIQDYLICVEMLVAAVVHSFVFPHTEYSPQAVEARNRALNQAPLKWHKKRLGRNKKYHRNYYSYPGAPWSTKDDFSKSSGMGLEMTSVDSGSLHTAETWEDPSMMWQQPGMQSQLSPLASPTYSCSGGHVTSRGGDVEDALLSPPENLSQEHHALQQQHNTLAPVVDDEDDIDNVDHASDDGEEEDYDDSIEESSVGDDEEEVVTTRKPGFVQAFIDSTIPRDLGNSTYGIVKGEYHVEKKTLLQHATTSDQYDLFSPSRRGARRKDDDT